MDVTRIGKNIKEKRISLGLTQEQLSEKADVSPAYIGMIERGEKVPKLETFVNIANSLNVTADELLGDMLNVGYMSKLASFQIEFEKLNRLDQLRITNMLDAFMKTEIKK